MLTSMLKEHQKAQSAHKEMVEKKKAVAVTATNALVTAMVDRLNNRVGRAYQNQKKLDAETKHLQQNAQNFARQTQQWLKLVDDFNVALKEIGDVENWARSMHEEMKIVTQTLALAYEQNSLAEQLVEHQVPR